MATKKPITNNKLSGAFGRLGNLSAPVVVNQQPEELPIEAVVAVREPFVPVPEQGIAVTATPLKTLEKAPKKALTMLVEAEEPKRIGRPTNKTGDVKSDYVKISPKVPRALKDRMDAAVFNLKKDAGAGISSLEDLVTVAVEAYLRK